MTRFRSPCASPLPGNPCFRLSGPCVEQRNSWLQLTLTLDLRLILAAHASIALLVGVLFAATWQATLRPACLAAWGGFVVAGMTASALYAGRDALPDGRDG